LVLALFVIHEEAMSNTIPHRLRERARLHPDLPAYHVKQNGVWTSTSWGRFVGEVDEATRALLALGFEPGQAVAILGFNRPEWVIAHHAGMSAAGAGAGIYTTCSAEEVAYILEHSEAPIVFLENRSQWEKVKATRNQLSKLHHVVMMKGVEPISEEGVLGWDEFLERGQSVGPEAVAERLKLVTDDRLATLIYTSGTTGPPKAVMLSHHNLAWTASGALQVVPLGPDDSTLSYLPLSHIAEQMFTIHAPATIGLQVYFAESMEKLADNLKEVQPTLLFGVPRVWEKIHTGITSKLKDAPALRKKIAEWAMATGSEMTHLRNRGEEPRWGLRLRHKIADRVVFRKVKAAIGLSKARYCVSGAAPISRDVLEFFGSLDVRILEVYGQSEDCGPTTFNQPNKARFGTVGPAIPGLELKIAEDGEILVRGPNVFMGYFKDKAATEEVLVDGWLHSGDLGSIDDAGFLTITGRKKEIIITAGGKNIAPKNIEAALKDSPWIAEAVVIGDRRRFLSAVLVLDSEHAERAAKERGWHGDVATHPELQAEVQRAVDHANQKFARVEQVRAWRLLPRPLTIADGELTPTLKVKRRKVEQHFSTLIESMYADPNIG